MLLHCLVRRGEIPHAMGAPKVADMGAPVILRSVSTITLTVAIAVLSAGCGAGTAPTVTGTPAAAPALGTSTPAPTATSEPAASRLLVAAETVSVLDEKGVELASYRYRQLTSEVVAG